MTEEIWRGRFKQYGPLELVDFSLKCTNNEIVRLALEELDVKLKALGIEPRRVVPAAGKMRRG